MSGLLVAADHLVIRQPHFPRQRGEVVLGSCEHVVHVDLAVCDGTVERHETCRLAGKCLVVQPTRLCILLLLILHDVCQCAHQSERCHKSRDRRSIEHLGAGLEEVTSHLATQDGAVLVVCEPQSRNLQGLAELIFSAICSENLQCVLGVEEARAVRNTHQPRPPLENQEGKAQGGRRIGDEQCERRGCPRRVVPVKDALRLSCRLEDHPFQRG
eukprot:6407078-Prymnesium_polylepis.2